MNKMLHIEQVHAVKFKYKQVAESLLRPRARKLDELHSFGIYATFLPPRNAYTFASDLAVRQATAVYLKKLAPFADTPTRDLVAELGMIEDCRSFGKLELDWGGVVETVKGCGGSEDSRNRSWIMVSGGTVLGGVR